MAILNINNDDFNTNLCDGLHSILATSEMSDVTLAVEGKYIKAHQLILSMCSTYFQELFRVTPSRNAIFFMKNVKHRIMQNLLLFIYEGKVQIPSEDVRLFMDTANELKIKGLTTDMHSQAAEVSRGQVHTADNTEHAIDAASSLKRAAEPMKENAKKYKPSNNEPDQPSSEASVLPLDTNKHIRETEDFNMNGIQVKEEVIETIDVGTTEMNGLDITNELDGHVDNTVISKESAVSLPSCETDHSVFAEMEVPNIDAFQPTEEKNDLIDIGPTEIQGSVDESRTLDSDKENNTMTIEKCLPPPPQGIPVTVLLCLLLKKVRGVIWDGFRYNQKSECGRYSQWHCTVRFHQKCNAKLLWLEEDGLISLSERHNHGKRRVRQRSSTDIVSRTLNAVSIDYFRKHML